MTTVLTILKNNLSSLQRTGEITKDSYNRIMDLLPEKTTQLLPDFKGNMVEAPLHCTLCDKREEELDQNSKMDWLCPPCYQKTANPPESQKSPLEVINLLLADNNL